MSSARRTARSVPSCGAWSPRSRLASVFMLMPAAAASSAREMPCDSRSRRTLAAQSRRVVLSMGKTLPRFTTPPLRREKSPLTLAQVSKSRYVPCHANHHHRNGDSASDASPSRGPDTPAGRSRCGRIHQLPVPRRERANRAPPSMGAGGHRVPGFADRERRMNPPDKDDARRAAEERKRIRPQSNRSRPRKPSSTPRYAKKNNKRSKNEADDYTPRSTSPH